MWVPLYGRVTYQMMKSYWPTVLNDPSSNEKDRAHAQWLANVGAIHFQKGMNIGDIVVSIGAMRMDGTRERKKWSPGRIGVGTDKHITGFKFVKLGRTRNNFHRPYGKSGAA